MSEHTENEQGFISTSKKVGVSRDFSPPRDPKADPQVPVSSEDSTKEDTTRKIVQNGDETDGVVTVGDSEEEEKEIKPLESIIYENGKLKILNQLMIPLKQEYEEIEAIEDGWAAIRLMKVRGAPAIAMVGAMSLVVELSNREDSKLESKEQLRDFIDRNFEYLKTARKTACNLERAKSDVLKFFDEQAKNEDDVEKLRNAVINEIEKMLIVDKENNFKIGEHGTKAILKGKDKDSTVSILTHCNTGSLATAGYGTALGVIRKLHEMEQLEMAYCTETRPYNQGSRLTAYELVTEKIPGTLITDSMVAAVIQQKKVDAVIVGADRIAKNGDVANKIGTLSLAVVAKYFGVPFYVAAPTSNFDFSMEKGEDIPIEVRPEHELVAVAGIRIAAPGIDTWNPAFDVTPAELITGGFITEKGVFMPSQVVTLDPELQLKNEEY